MHPEFLSGLLCKFPRLDVSWPADVRAAWYAVFRAMLAECRAMEG